MDAQDFAAQIVFVGSGFLRVPGRTSRLFVQGRKAVGGEGIAVVADRDVKIAVSVHEERACGMAALQALSGDTEENFFGGHVQSIPHHGKA